MRSFRWIFLSLVLVIFANGFVFAADLPPKLPSSGINDLPEPPSDGQVAGARANDFFITFSSHGERDTKFVTFGWLGWSPKVIHWLYNDSNRPAALAATPAAAVASIQNAMNKWTSSCNIQFVYDGTTSTGPSLSGVNFAGGGSRDSLNVIGWGTGGNLSSPTTGITYVSASGPLGGPYTLDESDIAINYAFNPNLDVTLVHEIGHMIGLDHSDIQNGVMSGPPLTPYVSQNTLQADDIAGCQALYGAPVVTTRTISGAITNGGGISGVTFCARPSAGVTCNASNGSGAYSCTVPNGWAGSLHSPSVAGNRIPPQVFTAVTSATTRNVSALSGVPSCNLDVDDNGLIEPSTDGVAILRRILGFSSGAFSGLSGTCAANTSASAIFNATNPAVSNYNVTGGAATRAATDGIVIVRVMGGAKTDAAVTGGLGLANESGATNTTWLQIQSWLNSTCGSSF